MKPWRRFLGACLCAALLATGLSGCGASASAPLSAAEESAPTLAPAPTIALMPLDSRPCNTQYPQLLAEAADSTVLLPPEEAMDQLLETADRDALWDWLEAQTTEADHLVIFTNTLFCGGLIASRSSDAYDDLDGDLTRLEVLCRNFQQDANHTITVVQVLPRLKPSQFDTVLSPYGNALTAYGQAWDQASAAGSAAPTSAEGVPTDVLEHYRALHEKSAALAQRLNDMATDGLIDHLVISQDDGDAYCPANVTFRALEKHQSANTTLCHGADELAMLLVSDLIADSLGPTPTHIVYSSDACQSTIYPYESIPLSQTVAEKMALAGLESADADADYTLYVHGNTEDLKTTTNYIAAFDSYLAIADVALTNQQDPALEEWLFASAYFDNVDAYAGWNTAGNSIGTVCAMIRLSATIDARLDQMDASQKANAAKALFRFRAVRYAEDSCYMTNISPNLQKELRDAKLMDSDTVFNDDAAWQDANARLTAAYAPYNEKLAAIFNGKHSIYFGKNELECTISNFSSSATFPWNRAFEVRIDTDMDVACS